MIKNSDLILINFLLIKKTGQLNKLFQTISDQAYGHFKSKISNTLQHIEVCTISFVIFQRNVGTEPLFWVITGLGIRGFAIQGICMERNPANNEGRLYNLTAASVQTRHLCHVNSLNCDWALIQDSTLRRSLSFTITTDSQQRPLVMSNLPFRPILK